MLLSFLLIVFIPVVLMGTIWFFMTMRQEKYNYIDRKENYIEEINREIERKISAVELDLAISKSDSVIQTYRFGEHKAQDVAKLSKSLLAFSKKHDIVYSIYFYDKVLDRIYNTNSGSYYFEQFYDTEWFESVGHKIQAQRLPLRDSLNQEFYQQIKGTTLENIYERKQVLTVVMWGLPEFYLVANIDIESLYQQIAGIYELGRSGEEFYFLTKDGTVLYGKDQNQIGKRLPVEYDGGQEILPVSYGGGRIYFIRPFQYKGLYCAVSYPDSEVTQGFRFYGFYIMGVCAVLALFLYLIARTVSKRLYRPIETLYTEIRQSAPDGTSMEGSDEFETVKRAFAELNTLCSDSAKNIQTYREFARVSVFHLYLKKVIGLEQFMKENGSLFDREANEICQMLVCRLETKKEDTFRYHLVEVLDAYLQAIAKGIFFEMEEGCFVAWIICSNESELNHIRELLMKALNELNGLQNYFATGELFRRPEELLQTYEACLEQLNFAIYFNRKNEEIKGSMLAVPKRLSLDGMLNYETGFIRAVIGKDSEEKTRLVRELEAELGATGNMTYCTNCCTRIIMTLDREFGLSAMLSRCISREFGAKETFEQQITYLDEMIEGAIAMLKADQGKENHYYQEAKRFLQENFTRNINITEVAESLSVSYPYLSRIFKSQSDGGQTLSDYLNLLRIRKSKELLGETGMTLCEIAEAVGYNNVQSYQRFFKKYENMTPGDYRKLKQVK